MDLTTAKTAREARMKAKKDRIKADMGTPAPEVKETHEDAPAAEKKKEAREKNKQTKEPEKKPE